MIKTNELLKSTAIIELLGQLNCDLELKSRTLIEENEYKARCNLIKQMKNNQILELKETK